MMDIQEAKHILAAFERESVEYVLVGSIALAAHGLIRATRDMDFFVAPTDENVERLKRALKSVYQDPNVDQISAADLSGEYPAVQYVPEGRDYSLDILARLGVAFSYDTLEWEEINLDGIPVRVATPAMLYRMKKDTVRLQDRYDAAWIRDRFDIKEDA